MSNFRNIQRPNKSFFQEPQELKSLVNTGNVVQKFLPKQADINKILKIIQRKALKNTVANCNKRNKCRILSPHFIDIYLYLAQNELSSTKTAIQEWELRQKNVYY